MKERGWSIIAERRKVTLLEEKAPELCLKLEGEFEGGDESVSLLEDGSYTVEVIFPPGCRDFSLRIGDEPIEALPFSVHIERGIAVGRLEMQNRLGDLTFELTLNGRKLTCTIKVRSRKLDYERHFEAMLSDLHRIAYNLRWDVLRAVTIQAFAGRPTRQPTPMEFLTILSSLFDRLFAALMLIARDPHHRLLREQVWCDPSKVRSSFPAGPHGIAARPPHHPNDQIPMTKSQIPTTQPPNHSDIGHWSLVISDIGHWSLVIGHCAKVLDERRVLDYDTPENRFVLHVMHLLLHRLRELSESPDAPPQVHRWLRQISALMREGLWDEIEPSPQAPVESLTLQLDPRYRTVFEVARLLQWGLGEWDGRAFRLSNRQTHELYEYWTFLNLIDLLREFNFHAGEQELSNLIRLTPQGLRLTLTVGEPSKVRLSRGEMQVTLTYQRAFSTITHRMVPDVTVELLCPGQPVRTVLFDAKYRVEQDASGQWGPTQEDIDQMHCYRDGIAPVIGGGVEGAFVLFPLEDEDGYRKHRYFLSIADGIGAFPLLPGSDSLLREWLSSWLGVEKP